MKEVIVEVGPGTIRGPNDVPLDWVSTALECIDDEIALLDDRPVAVRDLWDDVMGMVVGEGADVAVLVCPAWWSSARVDTARQAAHTVAAEVAVMERITFLGEGVSAVTAFVEITPDMAIVTASGTIAAVVPRRGADLDAEAVVVAVGTPAEVLVDVPAGVLGAERLASSIAVRLRAIGVTVTITDDDWVRRAVAAQRPHPNLEPAAVAARTKSPAVVIGVLSAALLGVGLAGLHDSGSQPPVGDVPVTLLVEGRVGVMVPATWTAQRITSGPGSARVQVISPTDDVALHITQSVATQSSGLSNTADSLAAALAASPGGAFVEFNPSDRRADREAVTYREIRPERHVTWTVVVDGTVRIAIGCQSAPGREHLVQEACDRAIRSARAVVEK